MRVQSGQNYLSWARYFVPRVGTQKWPSWGSARSPTRATAIVPKQTSVLWTFSAKELQPIGPVLQTVAKGCPMDQARGYTVSGCLFGVTSRGDSVCCQRSGMIPWYFTRVKSACFSNNSRKLKLLLEKKQFSFNSFSLLSRNLFLMFCFEVSFCGGTYEFSCQTGIIGSILVNNADDSIQMHRWDQHVSRRFNVNCSLL